MSLDERGEKLTKAAQDVTLPETPQEEWTEIDSEITRVRAEIGDLAGHPTNPISFARNEELHNELAHLTLRYFQWVAKHKKT